MKEWSKDVYQVIKAPVVSWCVAIGISANFVTLLNNFLTLTFGCYFFSRGEYLSGLLGLGVCLINGFLDYLDGDLARARGETGDLGIWLDSGTDVIIQNAIMGAIALGCVNMGLPVVWVVLFYIANCGNNLVSMNYNSRFGFDSDSGNSLFKRLMDTRKTWPNVLFKNVIDPTSNYLALTFYTFRYWIVLGALTNLMTYAFMAMTVISFAKMVIMYVVYSLYLTGSKNFFVLNVLRSLDEEQVEHYKLRYR